VKVSRNSRGVGEKKRRSLEQALLDSRRERERAATIVKV
jgi:hypothetical protein